MGDVPSQSERLRDLIRYTGLSDAGFARKIVVSRSLVNRVLKGERGKADAPSPTLVLGAYQQLGLRPAYWTSEGEPEAFIGRPPSPTELEELQGEHAMLLAQAYTAADEADESREVSTDLFADDLKQRSKQVHAAMVSSAARAAAHVPELRQAIGDFSLLAGPSDETLRLWAYPNPQHGHMELVRWWTEALAESIARVLTARTG